MGIRGPGSGSVFVRLVLSRHSYLPGEHTSDSNPRRAMSQSLHPLIDVFFESKVLNADGPVFVDFWEPRCTACRGSRSDLQRLRSHLSDHARVVSLNVNSYPDLAHTFSVSAVPTLLVFREGSVTARLQGAKKISALVDRVTSTINRPKAA